MFLSVQVLEAVTEAAGLAVAVPVMLHVQAVPGHATPEERATMIISGELLSLAHTLTGATAVSVRAPNLFGLGVTASLVSNFSAALRTGAPALIPAVCGAWVHVEDAAQDVAALLQVRLSGVGWVDLGSHQPPRCAMDVFRSIAQVLGKSVDSQPIILADRDDPWRPLLDAGLPLSALVSASLQHVPLDTRLAQEMLIPDQQPPPRERAALQRHVIFTSYLTSTIDPQRSAKRAPNRYAYVLSGRGKRRRRRGIIFLFFSFHFFLSFFLSFTPVPAGICARGSRACGRTILVP